MMTAPKYSKIPPSLVMEFKDALSITVLTGAGISAESGIPTFRQAQTGLWSQYNPEELATPGAFQDNPELVWKWYRWRQELITRSAPNPGHKALAELESYITRRNRDFTLITQNVDGLHQLAGSKNIIELHGSILRVKCFDCNAVAACDSAITQGEIQHCKMCNGLLRPDVVWFGESLTQEVIENAWNAANHCDIFLSIGTSGIVQPAAELPMVALQNGAIVVEINPHPTPLTSLATYTIQGPAGIVLPELIERLSPLKKLLE